MKLKIKKEADFGSPLMCLEKTTRSNNSNTMLDHVQALRDLCWQYAIKYQWDPIIGNIHEEYLMFLNQILDDCELKKDFG